MAEQSKCPVCSEKAMLAALYQGGSSKLNCVRCGSFEIGIIAANEISAWKRQQRTNLSGWICEHQGCTILSSDLKDLTSLRNPTVGEKAEKLLTFLANQFPKPGETIATNIVFSVEGLELSSVDQPKVFVDSVKLAGVSWSLDLRELEFLVYEYLVSEKEFLRRVAGSNLQISPKGWSQIDSLRHGNPESRIGFIAMWFDDSMKAAWIAIENGITDAGYKPYRVDQKEHNNDITDEITAGIRGSKFLVADLTKHRNGVYFEAGFAKGLGLEVIWLCRKDDEKDRHFDIRQYNCIFWEQDKLAELTKALENRIVATIGRGPLTKLTP